jgi:cyclic pyranopterin phosphate synthase
MSRRLTHIDHRGQARMVDVSDKPSTVRLARASGRLRLSSATRRLIRRGAPKGDVLALARSAGIQAAKRVGDVVPLAHPLFLTHASVELSFEKDGLRAVSLVKTTGPTGVELEALMAVWGALLTAYDMVKAVERGAVITDVRLEEKSGGRSGRFQRPRER